MSQPRGSEPCISASEPSSSSSSSSPSSSCSAERLTLRDVQAILDGVTYRPGWTFAADDESRLVRVRMEGSFENSREPGRQVAFGIDSWPPADAFNNEAAFLQWLLGRLIEHELHEAREWLRCDGQLVDDPHGPLG